eukprot:GHVP01063768.1.p1 GENE.GHVP01063768.1~~GHVP01063768.1.p1  ORF type:complete len:114 (-),score=16.24 GHVP01063768.1:134-475(-)
MNMNFSMENIYTENLEPRKPRKPSAWDLEPQNLLPCLLDSPRIIQAKYAAPGMQSQSNGSDAGTQVATTCSRREKDVDLWLLDFEAQAEAQGAPNSVWKNVAGSLMDRNVREY